MFAERNGKVDWKVANKSGQKIGIFNPVVQKNGFENFQ